MAGISKGDSLYYGQAGNDPLLGKETDELVPHIILATERRIIVSLLAQIEAVFKGDKEAVQAVVYSLAPLPVANGFFLAVGSGYKQRQEVGIVNYQDFLDITFQVHQFLCSSVYEGEDERAYGFLNGGFFIEFLFVKSEYWEYRDIRRRGCKDGRNPEALEWGSKKRQALLMREYIMNLNLVSLPSIKIPLELLNSRVYSLLRINQDSKSLPETTLLSLLILKATQQGNGLSLNREKLAKLQQTLKVYLRLLKGEITASPNLQSNNKNTLATAQAYLPRLDLQSLPSQLFWVAISLIVLILGLGAVLRGFMSLARAIVNRRYLSLYHEAEAFNEQLAYSSIQQNKRSFGFKGLSLGDVNTRSARNLTLSGLTARYLAFIDLIRAQYNGKVIIVIDELDKIHDPEQVRELLTEIKGALFNKGCFYLISISEDAARSFRYRLTSGRDIFESTFDEIIEIRQMSVQTGSDMLKKRLNLDNKDEQDAQLAIAKGANLPEYSLALLVLFAGGVPREIVRAARMLALRLDEFPVLSLAQISQLLLQEEITTWLGHFGETNLNGAETIKLKKCADSALTEFPPVKDKKAVDYAHIYQSLQASLQVIDPESLRIAVGFASHCAATNELDEQQLSYQIIASDIQACLRLMILTTIAELTEKTNNHWQDYEQAILTCHHVLADKPALAEVLLEELRKSLC